MPKRDEYEGISETGNWNVADMYSKLKIGKQLILADEYVTLAIFGTSSMIEDFEYYLNAVPKDMVRFKGFERLIQTLLLIISNSKFAIKNKDDRETLEKYEKILKSAWKIRDKLRKVIKSERTRSSSFKLEEGKYNNVLDELIRIKTEINTPLNKAHLIFTDKEEFDPQAFKESIKKRAINKG